MSPGTFDSLDGQVALVTGATRGIGAAIASDLADRGALVYAGARDPTDVTDSALRPVRLDVTDSEERRAAVERVETETGRLDVLVNNAGRAPPNVPLHEEPEDEVTATLDVNLGGTVHLTRLALPSLLDREGGRVVNVSSGDGAYEDVQEGYEGVAGSGHASYRISKAGVNALTVHLDGEYGSEGLLANAACPGAVATAMGAPDAPRTPAEGADTPAWLARFAPGSPSGRFWRDRAVSPW